MQAAAIVFLAFLIDFVALIVMLCLFTTQLFQLCQLYSQGGWTVTRVPKQGTYMTKGDRWITFSSPEDMREKVR